MSPRRVAGAAAATRPGAACRASRRKAAELWLDGGHNPDGGRALAAAMADLEERSAAPLVLVVGMLGTKDAAGFLRNFAGLARELIAVPVTGQIAARPPEAIAAIAASGRAHEPPSGRRRGGARRAQRLPSGNGRRAS